MFHVIFTLYCQGFEMRAPDKHFLFLKNIKVLQKFPKNSPTITITYIECVLQKNLNYLFIQIIKIFFFLRPLIVENYYE